MSRKHRNVRNVKARKGHTTPAGSGGGARSAKEPEEGRAFRAHLVIAPNVGAGRALIEHLGWRNSRVAIVTDPEYLAEIIIYPGEEIHAVSGFNPDFMPALEQSASMFCPGESYHLKIYVL